MLTGVTFNRTTDNSYLSLCGSTNWDNGAAITLNGKDRTDNNGFVKIRAKDSSHATELVLKPDGTATWGGTAISLAGHTHTKANITDFPTIPSKTSQLTNDSGFLTAHQSLSNYSTLANTVKSISISGKTITVTPGSGSAYTLTTQDTVYTHPTTAGNKHIPSGGSANQYLKYSESGTAVWANLPTIPSKTSQLTNDSGFLTSHQSLSNYSTLANTIKSLSISGRTITYTKGDNSTGTLTTQDNNTWTAMVGATSSANGSVGYVNAVPPKDGYNTKYLRADGTWQVPPDHTYTVNNATLTIQKNGTTVKTFTANASSNVTANITVPTKVSELTNDSGFLTSVLPIGSYIQFAGSQAPAGFLVCNGGAISRTTYSQLFAVIGTTYGSGNGSTTFNLPNLTDRFLQGSSTSGTVKNAGLPNITGFLGTRFVNSPDGANVITAVGGAFKRDGSTGAYQQTPSDYQINNPDQKITFSASASSSIYGNSTTVQPPALTCLICIKY